jgi:predicted pyridoxine 5'-phosphate oxidase superfamily flavin-nucleotide-binding protein
MLDSLIEARAGNRDPFHAGERAVQERVGVRERIASRAGAAIRDFMTEQHRRFFASLTNLPIAIVDRLGLPVATMLSGPRGFVSASDERTLRIAVLPDVDDAVSASLIVGAAVGVLGIDLATRRRNRANGRIVAVDEGGFTVAVEQSFGNCPKYIQPREVATHELGANGVRAPTESFVGLDAEARTLIAAADTLFVASCAEGGADMSHRGGRTGFVRVGGDVLTIPDFAGNRYFNTLGNFLVNANASLLFVDFASGDLLQVAGRVEVVWGGEEVRGFAGAERLWRVQVERAWRRRGVLAGAAKSGTL